MPKTNYAYEKRQRELEKKRKKEGKAQRKSPSPESGGPEEQARPEAGTTTAAAPESVA